MQRRIAQGIHRHGGVHRRAGHAHADRIGLRQAAALIQAAFRELLLKGSQLFLGDLLHAHHVREFARIRYGDGDLSAALRNDFHHDAGRHIARQNRLAGRAQRGDQLRMLIQVRLCEHGFIVLLRIAEALIREDIRRLLRQCAGYAQKRSSSQHQRSSPFSVQDHNISSF